MIMEVVEFLNFFKYLKPISYFKVKDTLEVLLNSNLKNIYRYIILNISNEDLINIYINKSTWDNHSEFSVIHIIIKTKVPQEIVYRFFYNIAISLNFRFFDRDFEDWFITNGWTTGIDITYFDIKAPFNLCLPTLHLDYNKQEMTERGLIIEIDDEPELFLSRSFSKHYRIICEIIIKLNVKIIKETQKIKALCMALYDSNNNILISGRIAQWFVTDGPFFDIKIKFICLPEQITDFLNRLYLYWESSKKDLNYNHGWLLI